MNVIAGVTGKWGIKSQGNRSSGLATFVVSIVILVAAMMSQATPASARYASLVVDGETGMELHSRNADTRRYPASLTKIMTLYMTFEALKTGKWTLNTRLKVSRRASRQPQTRLGLKAGRTIKVRDAILALITRSANDVATVVGENFAGTELRFAAKMTSRARKLGMTRTTFRNASGLPNKGQVSTARDMVKLATAIQRDFPQYYRYFKTKQFRFGGRKYKNHNRLLGRYAGTEGIKTGYTNASGYNLVASVKRDGRHLIGVVFGGKTGARRDRHMIRLLDRGFVKMAKIARLPKPPLPLPRPNRFLVAGIAADAASGTAIALASKAAASKAAASKVAASPDRRSSPGIGTTSGIPDIIPPDYFTHADSRSIEPVVLKQWGIQVGAYSNDGPAHAVIATARGHLGPAIDHGRPRVERVRRKHGIIYRARIVGLREVEARDACAILVAKHLPCVPVPADVEVASAPLER
jgi:D-alanyl-D-alanine carboxypeptidase